MFHGLQIENHYLKGIMEYVSCVLMAGMAEKKDFLRNKVRQLDENHRNRSASSTLGIQREENVKNVTSRTKELGVGHLVHGKYKVKVPTGHKDAPQQGEQHQ